MQKLFSIDGKLVIFLNRIADMVLLNLLWILCCLPIVTIGASTTAFFYVLLKMARDEESYIFSTFFRVFKENFKQSSLVWGIFALLGILLYLDFYVCNLMQGSYRNVLLILFLFIAFLVIATMVYAFPVMAFFENSTKKVLKNSFFMAIAHFPFTLMIMILGICPILLLVFGEFVIAAFFDVVIGFALAGWLNSIIFRRIFDRYLVS